MSQFQKEKKLVRDYYAAMELATVGDVADVLASFTSDDYLWRGVYPFREQQGASAAASNFWVPLKGALNRMQRREDIFIAGDNK